MSPAWRTPLLFCCESAGAETCFTNRLDPDLQCRRVFSFHRPETLIGWVQQPAQEKPWTKLLWIYDLRPNLHFTLKENTLKHGALDDFAACYNPKNRHSLKESERFKSFTYDELTMCDKVDPDIFWLKDDPLEGSANLPEPQIIVTDITADLESAREQFATIAEDLKG